MNFRFFHLFEYNLCLFWDDIDDINKFLEELSFMTEKEYKRKFGSVKSLKFKTKAYSYSIEITFTGDLIDFKDISRK